MPEFVVLSRAKAVEFIPTARDVCVSIYTPGHEAPHLREGWGAVHTVAFNDVPEAQTRLVEGDITDAEALAIVQFLRRHARAARVVIHCDAGRSRSPSVARAWHGDEPAGPNVTVYTAIRQAMY